MYKLFWLKVVLIPMAFISMACGSQGTRAERPLEWPLAYMVEKGPGVFYGQVDKGMFINAAEDVHLSKLVNLKLFGRFRPGYTIEQARTKFGPPLQTQSMRNGRVAVYEITEGRIEVAEQVTESSGVGSYHRRTVYLYPKSKIGGCAAKTVDVFDASVDKLIPGEGRIEVCVAVSSEGGQRVWALVNNKCVEAMNWY